MQGSDQAAKLHKLRMITATVKFPEFDSKEVWSPSQWNDLKTLWDGFNGTVGDPNHFLLCKKFSQAGEIEVWSVIEYKAGEIYVDIADDYDLTELEYLLPIVEKPETLMAEKKTGPNKPCPCGSGKKSKRCCG